MPMFPDAHHFVIQGSRFYDIRGNLTHTRGISGLEILHRAIATDASHDSAERYPPPECFPNTRNAVFDTIYRWMAETERKCSVLWLYGPAGAGKSAIAQTTAEYCESVGQLAASFFFSRGKHGRGHGKYLFSTIAYQLAVSIPETRAPIERAVEQNPSIVEKSMPVQLLKLIIEPCRVVNSCECSSKVVIIDGLDECEGSNIQHDILSLIGDAVTTHKLPLCFLIASRPEPRIKEGFDSSPYRSVCRRLNLGHSFWVDRDIRIFLESRFSDICEKHRHVMATVPKPWPSEGNIDYLVQKSSGQFIYASTVVKFIDDEFSRPTDQLNIVLGLTGSNSTAFADLDLLYMQILSANPDTDRLIPILGCIITLSTPLCACDIECLLSLEHGEVGLVLRGLHSVMSVPDSITLPWLPIVTLHASLGDFLTDDKRSGKFFIDSAVHHVHLALCCLTVATEQTHCSPDIRKNHRKSYIYATQNWDFHLSRSAPCELLFDYLRDLHFERLVDSVVVGQLHTAMKWLENAPNPPYDVIKMWNNYALVLYEKKKHEVDRVTDFNNESFEGIEDSDSD